MLQQSQPEDYVIATGKTSKLKDFIEAVFKCVNLDWQEYVVIDSSLYRPTDIAEGHADPTKAGKNLGWAARHKMEEVARLMVEDQLIKKLT